MVTDTPMAPTLVLPLLDSTFQRLPHPVAPFAQMEASALPPAACRCQASWNSAMAGKSLVFFSTMVTVCPRPVMPLTLPSSYTVLTVRAAEPTVPVTEIVHVEHGDTLVEPQVGGSETALR